MSILIYVSKMTRLTEIFQSKAQTKLLEHLLENRGKVFNQITLAKFLNVSPSTVSRIVEPLISQKILLYERFLQGMKVFCLNEEEEKTKLLLEFQQKLKRLG